MGKLKQNKIAEFSWNEIDTMTRAIQRKIEIDNFLPEVIVSILRGGAIPAVHLSQLLDVRPFYALNIQTTVSDEVHAERQKPVVLNDIPMNAIKNKRVLIVDDVFNTGVTLAVAQKFVQKYKPKEVKIAVLLLDTLMPEGKNVVKNIKVDYWIKKVHAWVMFPWNK